VFEGASKGFCLLLCFLDRRGNGEQQVVSNSIGCCPPFLLAFPQKGRSIEHSETMHCYYARSHNGIGCLRDGLFARNLRADPAGQPLS